MSDRANRITAVIRMGWQNVSALKKKRIEKAEKEERKAFRAKALHGYPYFGKYANS